jgi:2-haloacid dehalogenase
MTVPVVVFDVNETLSDMTAVAGAFAAAGAPPHLAQVWFAALLRDGFAAAAVGDLVTFADLGRSGARVLLAGPVAERGGDLDAAVEQVMASFTSLDLHPDVVPGITALAEASVRMVTLSNGAASVAEGLLRRAGIRHLIEHVLSVEDAGIWKPVTGAYRHAATVCGVDPGDLLMVAVHPWDLHGAAAAGLQTAWIRRPTADRPALAYPGYFTRPDHVVNGVRDLVAVATSR